MTSDLLLFKRLLLILRTVAFLRWKQVGYLLLRRLQGPVRPRRVNVPAISALRLTAMAEVLTHWSPRDVGGTIARCEAVMQGRFVFVGHEAWIRHPDWRTRHVSRLWNYNLHYFDYAVDLARMARSTEDERYLTTLTELLMSWIHQTADGLSDGWDAYPMSIRIVNWTYVYVLVADRLDEAVRASLASSLFAQLDALSRRQERHLLANHLQKNLTALAIGSLLFDNFKADEWRRLALRSLSREMDEQVLPDGMHCERSPMYHTIVLNDLLELSALLNACGERIPRQSQGKLSAMLRAYALVSRPNGKLHLFNDSADDIGPLRGQLADRAATVNLSIGAEKSGSWQLPDAGFCGLSEHALGIRLIIDSGVPGPRYQPAHAHCSLLSFELDIGEHRVVVDAGVSGYDGDQFREFMRSTRAHNTVSINGLEQSEVWGTFRMARRAKLVEAVLEDQPFQFRGAYRPYHSLETVHQRTIQWMGTTCNITDRIEGSERAELCSFLHFHPTLTVVREQDAFLVRGPGITLICRPFGFDHVRVEAGGQSPLQGWYAARFGEVVAAPVLIGTVCRNDSRLFGYYLDYRALP